MRLNTEFWLVALSRWKIDWSTRDALQTVWTSWLWKSFLPQWKESNTYRTAYLVYSSKRFRCFQYIAICVIVGMDYEQGTVVSCPASGITDPANPQTECRFPDYPLRIEHWGDRGSLISRPTSHIGMLHIFLCQTNHLCVSIPLWSQTIPNVGYVDSLRDCTSSGILLYLWPENVFFRSFLM